MGNFSSTEPQIVLQGRALGFGTWQNVLATPGTTGGGANTATAVAMRYASLWIPCQCYITGVRFLQGLTAATTKAIGAIFDSGGVLLGQSAAAGIVMATASTKLSLPLIQGVRVAGPGLFFLGVAFDGTGSTYGTIPANCHPGILGGSSVQAVTLPQTLSNLTISTTDFTDAQAPIMEVY